MHIRIELIIQLNNIKYDTKVKYKSINYYNKISHDIKYTEKT